MNAHRRAWIVSLALLLVALLVVPIGDSIWFEWFLNNQIYSLAFGWLSETDLILWAYFAIAFAVIGSMQRIFGGAVDSHLLAFAIGTIYSVTLYLRSTYFFAEPARTLDYLWIAGAFFVPPLASYLGAALAANVVGRAYARSN